jgi:hypothetical protein
MANRTQKPTCRRALSLLKLVDNIDQLCIATLICKYYLLLARKHSPKFSHRICPLSAPLHPITSECNNWQLGKVHKQFGENVKGDGRRIQVGHG